MMQSAGVIDYYYTTRFLLQRENHLYDNNSTEVDVYRLYIRIDYRCFNFLNLSL